MMSEVSDISSVNRLARQLADDIRVKGLQPGDCYMTAIEASGVFRVSRSTANRALALLANRGVVVRRRNRGTFIGQGLGGRGAKRSSMIHLFLSTDRLVAISTDAMLEGVRQVFPDKMVQLNLLPPREELAAVRQVIAQSRSLGGLLGVVAISCPREIYRWLDQERVPTAIMGSAYADTQRLVSVDIDYHQAGRLLGDYLARRGHRNWTLLIGEHWRPGDGRLLEGLAAAMTEAGLPPSTLKIRSLSCDLDLAAIEIGALLEAAAQPLALICWHPAYAEVAHRIGRQLGREQDGSLEVVLSASHTASESVVSMARTAVTRSPAEHMATAVRMLAEVAAGREPKPRHVVIPVEFREPERSLEPIEDDGQPRGCLPLNDSLTCDGIRSPGE